jgi:hypothetical protein
VTEFDLMTVRDMPILDNLDAVCAAILKRLNERIARSAGQHKRALHDAVKRALERWA